LLDCIIFLINRDGKAYLATSITLISLIRFTLTSPGYESLSCISSAIFLATSAASISEIVLASTNTLISLPADRA
jgi:hypothetical protein